MESLGLINGKYINLDEPVISIEDRGYQFGDGVYEVVVVYNGKPFMLDEHMDRMLKSAALLKIQLPYSKKEIIKFHYDLITKSRLKDATIYSQFTRGVAPRKHNFPEKAKAELTMAIRPLQSKNEDAKNNGVKTILVPDERWLKCNIKSLNLLGNILAKQAAYEAGCFEAIQHREGMVTEGSSTNVFVVKEGVIHTHPTNNLILCGITRIAVIEIINKLGFSLKEEAFSTEFLFSADEVFLTGTTTDVMPVIQISDKLINGGIVGQITKELQKELFEKIKADCFTSISE